MSYLMCAMLAQLAMHLTVAVLHRRQWVGVITSLEAERQAEREAWNEERRQLLDRIQAPSFAELKHAEVKVIKAQQGIKEPAPLEVL